MISSAHTQIATRTTDIIDELRRLRPEISRARSLADMDNLANRLSRIGLTVSRDELPKLIPALMQATDSISRVPAALVQAVTGILHGKTAAVVCAPWADFGALAAAACETVRPNAAFAFSQHPDQVAFGRVAARSLEWQLGDPLPLLSSLSTELDVAVSILPIGIKTGRPLTIQTPTSENLNLIDELGNLILAAASMKLSRQGLGLFVVPGSFFLSPRSIYRRFDELGLGLDAALAMPVGAFAPYTHILTYLVLVRKQPTTRMFVAQLSTDTGTNDQIIANLRQGEEGGTLELGRFVAPKSFTGLGPIRAEERFSQALRQSGARAVRLGDLATSITLGRPAAEFSFRIAQNAVFVPLIGISDVIDAPGDLTLKPQNYAQVEIDPTKSNARFVARFLNTELGREIRDYNKAGFIPKLNKQSLQELRLLVPDLPTQNSIMEIEGRVTTANNILLGLQNELAECQRQLWRDGRLTAAIDNKLTAVTARISSDLAQHTVQQLDQWFETLPFPLASILRAWQATSTDDYKTRYEHLLHFFEATAEFFAIIFLSAFISNDALFLQHRDKITESMKKQNVTFERATFGTWKFIIEYFAKQTRQMLSGDEQWLNVARTMFADQSITLPQVLSQKELMDVFATTNKMRNDWTGHGGVVGEEAALLRNEQLLAELQRLRNALADVWRETSLIRALNCRPRRGVFENEISIMNGSNNEFLKQVRGMSTWLDVDHLYLVKEGESGVLKLLPLVKVGPSPQSARNACYFFSRLEKDGARFVSYHFIDRPEFKDASEEATELVRSLISV